jgi:hypothetical protein
MLGARVGRSSSNAAPQELGAILWTRPTSNSGGLKVAGVRSTIAHEVDDDLTEVTCKPFGLGLIQRTGRTGRIQTGSPKCFVSDEIADPGDSRLIEKTRLQSNLADCHSVAKLTGGDREDVGPKSILIGVELNTAQPSRVTNPKISSVREVQYEAIPGWIVLLTRVFEVPNG